MGRLSESEFPSNLYCVITSKTINLFLFFFSEKTDEPAEKTYP